MSIGQSPTVKRTRYTAQSADPVNPIEGDFFYSDGTPRARGPWVYMLGAWSQVSTSGALNIVNNLTFSPQSADPGSPVKGMVFYADGTSRADGLWLYNGTGWVQLSGLKQQEAVLKEYQTVRVATTANIILASQLENGDTIDGVVLATGNIVLVKNQTTASENGVYIVAVSGPPARHSSADTFQELNNYAATVTSGTVNANTIWFQTATLTSLSDAQTWATTPATQSFTVPAGVNTISVKAIGGGGGGGGGASNSGSAGGGAGGGGAGLWVDGMIVDVTPGEVLTITLGVGGAGGVGGSAAAAGTNGTLTSIIGTGVAIYLTGGGGGSAGTISGASANGKASDMALGGVNTGGTLGGGPGGGSMGAGGGTVSGVFTPAFWGGGGSGEHSGATAQSGGKSPYVNIPAIGGTGNINGGGGGGGGSGFAAGGAGTNVGNNLTPNPGPASSGAGGGGGGGSNSSPTSGSRGGRGGSGFVHISW